uniref:Uncharacterized protein n=1 Tax=Romanomermis culicivorax TaxID=13658 RepID=A0A915HNE5_ROMCU
MRGSRVAKTQVRVKADGAASTISALGCFGASHFGAGHLGAGFLGIRRFDAKLRSTEIAGTKLAGAEMARRRNGGAKMS